MITSDTPCRDPLAAKREINKRRHRRLLPMTQDSFKDMQEWRNAST